MHNILDILSVTVLCTSKFLKWLILCYVYLSKFLKKWAPCPYYKALYHISLLTPSELFSYHYSCSLYSRYTNLLSILHTTEAHLTLGSLFPLPRKLFLPHICTWLPPFLEQMSLPKSSFLWLPYFDRISPAILIDISYLFTLCILFIPHII